MKTLRNDKVTETTRIFKHYPSDGLLARLDPALFERTNELATFMDQFGHIDMWTGYEFENWQELVATMDRAGIEFVEPRFTLKEGGRLHTLEYAGAVVGYASEAPMALIDSQIRITSEVTE